MVDSCITNVVYFSFVAILLNAFYPLAEFLIAKIKVGKIKKQRISVKRTFVSNSIAKE